MYDALINVNGEQVPTLDILLMLTIISLLPSLLVMVTSFTRTMIILSFLRTAMGVQQTPPNMVLVGISIFLTLFIMNPVISEINTEAYTPYKNNEITSVKNGNFLSEAQTDFIFSVIGEEFGFKGSVVVIVLLFSVALECISVARKAKDVAGTIIPASMGGLVAFQGFFNIGVATFILPTTGLTLPFVSNGLTSLLSLFIGMGFVLNVRLQAKKSKQ